MDYLTQYELDDLCVLLSKRKYRLKLNEINLLNDGFNQLCCWQLLGIYKGEANNIYAWKDEKAQLRLNRVADRYYQQGIVTACEIIDGTDEQWTYKLTVQPELIKLTYSKRNDYYSNMSLKALLATLLERHNILDVVYQFDEKIHPFELQYQQTDYDVFCSLITQYGLTFYYEPNATFSRLVIAEQAPKNNSHQFLESEAHNMLHAKPCVFNVNTCSQHLANQVLLRSSDLKDNAIIVESKRQNMQQACAEMTYHCFHDIYVSENQQSLESTAIKLQAQLQWQQQQIQFSIPLLEVLPGDVVELQNTKDPRHAKKYHVISINTHFKKWLKDGGEHFASSIQVTAIPCDVEFMPIHPKLASVYVNQALKTNYETPTPPLLIGKISGSVTQSSLQDGCYKVHLDLNQDKVTPKCRSLQTYTGNVKKEAYGVDFPLYGETDVVLAMQNNCSQRLVVLGSYAHASQKDMVNNVNAKQHIIRAYHNLELCFDSDKNIVSLSDNKNQHQLSLSAQNEIDSITLEAKLGEIHLSAEKQLKQCASNRYKLSASSIRKDAGSEFTFETKNLYLKAKQNISYQTSHTLIKSKSFDIKGNTVRMNAKNIAHLSAANRLNIKTKKLKLQSGKSVQLHADKILNLNISKSRINFKSSGELNTNKKIELHANKIKKHQLSLINCGGSAEFEVDDFFKQQFSDVHDNDEFRKRKGKQQAQYNKEFYEMKFVRMHHEVLPMNSNYLKYKNFMSEHDFIASIADASSIPGTVKEVYSQSKGDFLSTINSLQEIDFIKNGGWNETRDLHIEYLQNGQLAKYKYYQENGLINEGQAILEGTSGARAALASKSYFKTTLTSGLKGAVRVGAPLAVTGDVLQCGLDTYYHAPDSICSSTTVFAKNLALDVPKGVLSGVVGAGAAAGVGTGITWVSGAILGAESGTIAGPIGAAIGFCAGVYLTYLASDSVDSLYEKMNFK